MNTPRFSHSTPHLPVKNLRQTLDYYRDRLGFTDEWTFGSTDGGIRRDNLRMLFAEDTDFTSDINNGRHRLPLMWFVQDIDIITANSGSTASGWPMTSASIPTACVNSLSSTSTAITSGWRMKHKRLTLRWAMPPQAAITNYRTNNSGLPLNVQLLL